jgi:hypothetical protein
MKPSRSREPILVTGVPRSGTTWLARWLAEGERMALPGREPMNPRGNSYALGGTVSGWARLTAPTPAQRLRLRLAYRGLNPLVYSRYGHRQAGAALPGRRLVIKDPFALLSIPGLVEVTGALPVLVYRHPGAVLASYRRMGWTPDLDELDAVVGEARADGLDISPPPAVPDDSPEAMGHFWATLHQIALTDLERAGIAVTIVSHAELAASGEPGGRRLADHLGVAWAPGMAAELAREGDSQRHTDHQALHRFDRAPVAVAEAWRRHLPDDDVAAVEAVTAGTRERLEALRLPLTT